MDNNSRPHTRMRAVGGLDPGINHVGLYVVEFYPDALQLTRSVLCASFEEPLSKRKRETGEAYWHWTSIADRVSRWVNSQLTRIPLFALDNHHLAMEDFLWIGKRRKSLTTMFKVVGYLYAKVNARLYVFTPGEWRRTHAEMLGSNLLDWCETVLRPSMPPQNEHEDDAFRMCCVLMQLMMKGDKLVL